MAGIVFRIGPGPGPSEGKPAPGPGPSEGKPAPGPGPSAGPYVCTFCREKGVILAVHFLRTALYVSNSILGVCGRYTYDL